MIRTHAVTFYIKIKKINIIFSVTSMFRHDDVLQGVRKIDISSSDFDAARTYKLYAVRKYNTLTRNEPEPEHFLVKT